MNRSRLFYPLNRGMDADVGGAAELQTDVMRFMAIISLCLVAIFALVQTLPMRSLAEKRAPPVNPLAVAPGPEVAAPHNGAANEETVTLQRPQPRPPAQADPSGPVPVKERAIPVNAAKGFTLRFESDQALLRLVERGIVGLYVITPRQAYRMNVASANVSFWTASTPARLHEMDSATVPDSVLAAYRRSNPSLRADEKWAVSIPATLSGQINAYLKDQDGGALVIGLDGTLRLEH